MAYPMVNEQVTPIRNFDIPACKEKQLEEDSQKVTGFQKLMVIAPACRTVRVVNPGSILGREPGGILTTTEWSIQQYISSKELPQYSKKDPQK
jgi:hypothetical protein